MTSSREEVLRRVRAAEVSAPMPAGPPTAVPADPAAPQAPSDLTAMFVERVRDYGAVGEVVPRRELAACIAEVLGTDDVVLVGVPDDLPVDWTAALPAASVRRLPRSATTDDVLAVDATVTGCALAIADTGTVVLDAGPRQGRRTLSLLPDIHVCVVEESQIVASVPEAVRAVNPYRPMTWVSGPSATSDIELDRVVGVHGPRRLVVMVSCPDTSATPTGTSER